MCVIFTDLYLTGKIKYPDDANQGLTSPTAARHPELPLNNGSSPSPTSGLQNEASSPTTGYHPSNLAHQRQSTMPPRSDSPITNHNAPFPDNRQPQQGRPNQLSVHPPNGAPGGPTVSLRRYAASTWSPVLTFLFVGTTASTRINDPRCCASS